MSQVAIVTSHHHPRLEMRVDPDAPAYTDADLEAYREQHNGDDPPPTPLQVRAQCDTGDCPWEGEWHTTDGDGTADGKASIDVDAHTVGTVRHGVTVTVTLEPGDFAANYGGDGEQFARVLESALVELPGGTGRMVAPTVTVARYL